MKWWPFKRRTWNWQALEAFADWLEDHEELWTTPWKTTELYFIQQRHPAFPAQLDRNLLAAHLRLPYATINQIVFPQSEGMTDRPCRMGMVIMLHQLARTGKVAWP